MTPRTDTKTLAQAMFILARDIHGGDGVANAAITEAGHRLQELDAETVKLRGESKVLRDLMHEAAEQMNTYSKGLTALSAVLLST